MKIKKVVNLAWYVQNTFGHNYMYANTIQSILNDYEIELISLVNKHCSQKILSQEKTFIPFFDLHIYKKYNKFTLLKPIYNIFCRFLESIQFRKQIQKAIRDYKGEDTLFFIQDIHREDFFSLSLAFQKEQHPTIGLFRYSPFLSLYGRRKKPKLKNVFFRDTLLKKMLKQNTQFIMASDSQIILDHLCLFSGRKEGICFPIPVHTNIQIKKKVHKKEKKRKFLFGIGGIFARNKGVDNVLEALKYIHEKKLFDVQKIEFVFQKPKEIAEWYLKFLKTLKDIGIHYKIYETYLLKKAYSEFINEIDICLLHYKLEDGYDTRTSGVFIESVFYQKPFITTKDSWMHYESKNLIYSGLFVENNNYIDLALAMQEMTEKYDDFLKHTLATKKFIEQRHNRTAFLNCFLNVQDKK